MNKPENNINDYLDYLIPTVAKFNSRKVTNILNRLEHHHVAIKTKDLTFPETDIIIIDEITTEGNSLSKVLNTKNMRAINIIEEFEYQSDYVHSAMFKTDKLNKEDLLKSLEAKGVPLFSLNKSIPETLTNSIDFPSYYIPDNNDNIILLKFSMKWDYTVPFFESAKLKFPIILVIDIENSALEIRFNRLPLSIANDNIEFYRKICDNSTSWIKNNLNISTRPFELINIVDYIYKNEQAVKTAMHIKRSSGGEAQLNMSSGDTMPILDELRDLISENEEMFSDAAEIKELLEAFIKEIEDDSSYEWVALEWDPSGKKKDRIKVKFLYDYLGPEVSLLFHFSGRIGMEKMEYVREQLCSAEGQFNSSNSGE